MAWEDRAACRGASVDYFSKRPERIAVAVALCSSCPVRVECLADDLDHAGAWRFGVRGGLRPTERVGLVDLVAGSSAVEVARSVLVECRTWQL